MKRPLAMFLFLINLLMPILALATDYASMSNDDLLIELKKIRAEIDTREFNQDKIICDCDGMVITLAGEIEESTRYDGTPIWTFPIIAVNNSDIKLYVVLDKVAINGWEIDTNNYLDIGPGNKAKEVFEVRDVYEKTDITSIADIEVIEFVFHTTNSATSRYITKDTRKTIVFKKD